MTTQATTQAADFRQEFESRFRGQNGPYSSVRRSAFDRFSTTGFPTTREEEWRFTNVGSITGASLDFAIRGTADLELLSKHPLLNLVPNRVVFLDGFLVSELSKVCLEDCVVVGSLQASMQHPAVKAHLGRYAGFENHAFAALNTAFAQDGAFIYVPRNCRVEDPIHLLFFSTGKPGVLHVNSPRNLIVLEESSRATVLESYLSLGNDAGLTNSVTEAVVAPNALLEHDKLQDENPSAFHVSFVEFNQSRDSSVVSHTVTFGGSLVRNDIACVLDGEGANCVMNGLYFVSGSQLVDNHTRIDHAKANCESHELFKGILDDHAKGVFNGRIIVRPDAQKTNSKQTNKTLVLSEKSTINTNPQLEIFADDVKCTHGATVGQLDENSLFYLRSRGISRNAARRLLTFAFANDLIGRISVEELRQVLEKRVLETQHASDERQGEVVK